MGNRPKVDKEKFIQDIRAGLTREDLRSKYQMTQTAFQNLLNQLQQKGRITNDDIARLGHSQPYESITRMKLGNLSFVEGQFRAQVWFGVAGSARMGTITEEMLELLGNKTHDERMSLVSSWYGSGQLHDTEYLSCDQGQNCTECPFQDNCSYEFP